MLVRPVRFAQTHPGCIFCISRMSCGSVVASRWLWLPAKVDLPYLGTAKMGSSQWSKYQSGTS